MSWKVKLRIDAAKYYHSIISDLPDLCWQLQRISRNRISVVFKLHTINKEDHDARKLFQREKSNGYKYMFLISNMLIVWIRPPLINRTGDIFIIHMAASGGISIRLWTPKSKEFGRFLSWRFCIYCARKLVFDHKMKSALENLHFHICLCNTVLISFLVRLLFTHYLIQCVIILASFLFESPFGYRLNLSKFLPNKTVVLLSPGTKWP